MTKDGDDCPVLVNVQVRLRNQSIDEKTEFTWQMMLWTANYIAF